MSKDRERIDRAFEQAEKDEKLVDDVLAMKHEELLADLGGARAAKARVQAEEMQKRFLALAADMPAEPHAGPPSARARAALADGARDAPPLVAIGTSPEPDEAEGRGRVVRLRTFAPLWLIAAVLASLAVGASAALGLFDRKHPEPAPNNHTPDQPTTVPTAPEPVPENRAATSTDGGRADPAPSAQDAAKPPDRPRPHPVPAPNDGHVPGDKGP